MRVIASMDTGDLKAVCDEVEEALQKSMAAICAKWADNMNAPQETQCEVCENAGVFRDQVETWKSFIALWDKWHMVSKPALTSLQPPAIAPPIKYAQIVKEVELLLPFLPGGDLSNGFTELSEMRITHVARQLVTCVAEGAVFEDLENFARTVCDKFHSAYIIVHKELVARTHEVGQRVQHIFGEENLNKSLSITFEDACELFSGDGTFLMDRPTAKVLESLDCAKEAGNIDSAMGAVTVMGHITKDSTIIGKTGQLQELSLTLPALVTALVAVPFAPAVGLHPLCEISKS